MTKLKENIQKSTNGLSWILLIALALIWGSSFILIKKSLVGLNPVQVGSLRIFAAFLCFIPFYKKGIKEVKKEKYGSILASGLTGNLFPAFLFAIAQTQIQSSVSGVLNSLSPIFVLIISTIFFKDKFKKIQVLGLILGFIGCFFLIGFKGNSFQFDINYYAFFIVIATICYGTSANIIKYKLAGIHPIHISSLALLAVGPIAGLVFIFNDGIKTMLASEVALKSGLFAMLLGAIASAIALVMFNKLIQIAPIIFASSVTYLIPIIAICWGLFDGESISMIQLFGIGIIIAALLLIKK